MTAGPATTPAAVLLMGPTGSGKTALALDLARRWPIEIISVDSANVYRGMDVGTSKPTLAERAGVPHHLIDIRDPAEAYSAGEFRRDAVRLIAEIRARGRVPLLVGGTMLYFRALRSGLAALPPKDPAVRVRINERARELGWPALHAELARLDPGRSLPDPAGGRSAHPARAGSARSDRPPLVRPARGDDAPAVCHRGLCVAPARARGALCTARCAFSRHARARPGRRGPDPA
jgi:hypothetical protein